jgi:hypothetical protein
MKATLIAVLLLAGCDAYQVSGDGQGGVWRVNLKDGAMQHCIAEPAQRSVPIQCTGFNMPGQL